jgi:hypothetical protein
VAKAGDALQLVSAQIRKHRVHFQNDRKFGLFTHCIAFQIGPGHPKAVSKIPYPMSVS